LLGAAKETKKNIANTQVVSCMNPTAGRFFEIAAMVRNFCYGYPWVYFTAYTFLDGHLVNFSDEVKAVSNYLIKTALGLHTSVSGAFKKTAANFLYEFNIRHINNVLGLSGFTRL